MSGILDSKSRVFDFALTPQGRRQLASGKIRFVKATVSDRSSFYEKEPGGGATDATQRIYFETYQRSGDQVTVESDDSGLLLPFPGANQDAANADTYTNRAEFASSGASLALDSASNFLGLKVLLTNSDSDELDEFTIRGSEFVFYNTLSTASKEKHVDHIESVLFDKRLQRKNNFLYLPPINDRGRQLGTYSDIRQGFNDGPDVAVSDLISGKKGEKRQIFTSNFSGKPRDNILNIQVFEKTRSAEIRKLDLIDFGEIRQGDKRVRVIFAGRVLLNSFQFPTFFNILTLVLK